MRNTTPQDKSLNNQLSTLFDKFFKWIKNIISELSTSDEKNSNKNNQQQPNKEELNTEKQQQHYKPSNNEISESNKIKESLTQLSKIETDKLVLERLTKNEENGASFNSSAADLAPRLSAIFRMNATLGKLMCGRIDHSTSPEELYKNKEEVIQLIQEHIIPNTVRIMTSAQSLLPGCNESDSPYYQNIESTSKAALSTLQRYVNNNTQVTIEELGEWNNISISMPIDAASTQESVNNTENHIIDMNMTEANWKLEEWENIDVKEALNITKNPDHIDSHPQKDELDTQSLDDFVHIENTNNNSTDIKETAAIKEWNNIGTITSNSSILDNTNINKENDVIDTSIEQTHEKLEEWDDIDIKETQDITKNRNSIDNQPQKYDLGTESLDDFVHIKSTNNNSTNIKEINSDKHPQVAIEKLENDDQNIESTIHASESSISAKNLVNETYAVKGITNTHKVLEEWDDIDMKETLNITKNSYNISNHPTKDDLGTQPLDDFVHIESTNNNFTGTNSIEGELESWDDIDIGKFAHKLQNNTINIQKDHSEDFVNIEIQDADPEIPKIPDGINNSNTRKQIMRGG